MSDQPDPAFGNSQTIEQVEAHIARHIGKPTRVWHELVSDKVHIDIHVVEPNEAVPFYTLVTSGMSDRPMSTPPDASQRSYAEMVIRLPADWPVSREAFKDESHYFPMRLLKMLARLPHDYNTFLASTHTVPNGDPARPYAPNTNLCCAMIYVPVTLPQDFFTLQIDDTKTIHFYGTFLLYKEEMDFKLKHGADALLEIFRVTKVTELVEVTRPSVILG
jgi:hypothetical protein